MLRYLSWYRSFPALCVFTLPSTLETKLHQILLRFLRAIPLAISLSQFLENRV